MLQPVQSTYVPQYVPIPVDRFVEAARSSEERALLAEDEIGNINNAFALTSSSILPGDADVFDTERQAIQQQLSEAADLTTSQRLRGVKRIAREFGQVAAPLQARYAQYNKDLDGIRQLGLPPDEYANAVQELNSKYEGIDRSSLIQGRGLPELVSGNLAPYVDLTKWTNEIVSQIRPDQISPAELTMLGMGGYQVSETTGFPEEIVEAVAKHRLDTGQGGAYLRQKARFAAQRDPNINEEEWYNRERDKYVADAIRTYSREVTNTRFAGAGSSNSGTSGSGNDPYSSDDTGAISTSISYMTSGDFTSPDVNINYRDLRNATGFDLEEFNTQYREKNPPPSFSILNISERRAREIARNPNKFLQGSVQSRSSSGIGLGNPMAQSQGTRSATSENESLYARQIQNYQIERKAAAVDAFRNSGATYSSIRVENTNNSLLQQELVSAAVPSGSNINIYEVGEDGQERAITRPNDRTAISHMDVSHGDIIPPNALNPNWRVAITVTGEDDEQPRRIMFDYGGNTQVSTNMIRVLGREIYKQSENSDANSPEARVGKFMQEAPNLFSRAYVMPTKKPGEKISFGQFPGFGEVFITYNENSNNYTLSATGSNQTRTLSDITTVIDKLAEINFFRDARFQ